MIIKVPPRKRKKKSPIKPKYMILKATGVIKDAVQPMSKSLWPNQAVKQG